MVHCFYDHQAKLNYLHHMVMKQRDPSYDIHPSTPVLPKDRINVGAFPRDEQAKLWLAVCSGSFGLVNFSSNASSNGSQGNFDTECKGTCKGHVPNAISKSIQKRKAASRDPKVNPDRRTNGDIRKPQQAATSSAVFALTYRPRTTSVSMVAASNSCWSKRMHV